VPNASATASSESTLPAKHESRDHFPYIEGSTVLGRIRRSAGKGPKEMNVFPRSSNPSQSIVLGSTFASPATTLFASESKAEPHVSLPAKFPVP
jgi:hypothetical protein